VRAVVVEKAVSDLYAVYGAPLFAPSGGDGGGGDNGSSSSGGGGIRGSFSRKKSGGHGVAFAALIEPRVRALMASTRDVFQQHQVGAITLSSVNHYLPMLSNTHLLFYSFLALPGGCNHTLLHLFNR
jgi:hypothetical protein